LIVSFDEDRIDAVRGGVIQQIHDAVDRDCRPASGPSYNGSLEISETYNRITLDNQQKFTPPILFFTVAAIFVTFRSFRKTLLTLDRGGGQRPVDARPLLAARLQLQRPASMIVPLIVILAIADDVHIMQHWDEERRHGASSRRSPTPSRT
jgi:predicted RND superfamily exporter protein